MLSGFGQVVMPHTDQSAYISGGKNNIIIAADTPDICDDGHISIYPSGGPTTILMIPFRDGKIPPHRVLHDGVCEEHSLQPGPEEAVFQKRHSDSGQPGVGNSHRHRTSRHMSS